MCRLFFLAESEGFEPPVKFALNPHQIENYKHLIISGL